MKDMTSRIAGKYNTEEEIITVTSLMLPEFKNYCKYSNQVLYWQTDK